MQVPMMGLIAFAVIASCALAADPRPWPPQYKIRPDQKQRLTPADIVGPDGIVYPNWTRCGVEGGIPAVKAVCRLAAFGGKPRRPELRAGSRGAGPPFLPGGISRRIGQ